ncbi:hypothetical protein GGX14DRAFT_405255 [Mycena pura]|uniref:HNH nuclease domain-containing protein n=1 Tax=Mycena pura TaxID=153505 RepID=A0AAD6Y0P7_9AGAR|nr:hypothetical protein GGX14DRAFT_405255 [Mycena pura]
MVKEYEMTLSFGQEAYVVFKSLQDEREKIAKRLQHSIRRGVKTFRNWRRRRTFRQNLNPGAEVRRKVRTESEAPLRKKFGQISKIGQNPKPTSNCITGEKRFRLDVDRTPTHKIPGLKANRGPEHSSSFGRNGLMDQVNYYDFNKVSGCRADYRKENHGLLKIDDPRGRGLPHPNTYHNLLELRADPSRPVPQGHYILVAVERYSEGHETMTRLVPCSVGQQEPAIGQRSVTRTATAGSATFARDDDLRADVRVRDMRCRITGDTAPQRDRGANFMGLEVAHVFPLGEVEQFSMAFDSNSASHRAGIFDALDLSDQPRKEEIDIPENAVVLRRDVHSHFDGYEITLESRIVKGQTVQVVRLFEKDAAPGIARDAGGMYGLFVDKKSFPIQGLPPQS